MRHFYFFIFLLLINFGCKKKKEDSIIIATSANMQFAIKDIATAFTKSTGIDCNLVISSSGKLSAQIKEGAPYDIFVSADIKYPTSLFKSGFTTENPKIYAFGQLVLWSALNEVQPSIELLSSDSIKHIAVANPKTAPYGQASMSVLKIENIYDKIDHKLVYGESISQTNQFIISGAAQIGITSKSVVLSSHVKNIGSWIDIDKKSYPAIKQGAVIIKKDSIHNASLKFYDFLFSSRSKEILENFGYLVP